MRTKALLAQTAPHGEMHRDDRFLSGIFRRFLPPTMLSVLGGTINVLVDCAIVGNMMGPAALAAINLCGPIFLLFCAVGSLIGSGGGFLAASMLGRNEEEKSGLCYTASVALELLVGLLLMGLGSLFLHQVTAFLGADKELYQMTLVYARISFWGAPLKCLIYIPFHFLRLDGKPGAVSISLLAMTAANGILDVLLIHMGLGMAGASLASVLGTLLGVAVGFAYLKNGSFHLVSLRGARGILPALLALGTPAALNNLLSMARMMLLNRLLMRLGGSAWVAVFTAVGSMSDFSLCMISGVPQTASPLVGVYCAERNNIALRHLMKMQISYGGLLITLFAVGTALFPAQICALFGLESSPLASVALRLFALSLPCALLCSCLIFFYNASGRVQLANAITVCRVFLFAVGPALAFSSMGLPVWLFFPVAELFTLVALLPALWGMRKFHPHLSPILLLDETLERDGKVIDFSVENHLQAVTQAAERIGAFCQSNCLTPRQTMAVSLSIEEMLILLLEHCFHAEDDVTADVRVFVIQDTVGIRIRNAGEPFNPIAYYEAYQDTDKMGETLGIRMILKIAETVKYQRTFGVNTLTILL